MLAVLLTVTLTTAAPVQLQAMPEAQQLEIMRLLWRESQAQGLEMFCRMWAYKYRLAYHLDDKGWKEFQRKAPRHIGRGKPYDVEYDEDADNYADMVKTLHEMVVILAKLYCPPDGALFVTDKGVVSCQPDP